MTPRAAPLSENGKVIAICLLFPLFWPFLPVILICMAAEKIRNAYWDWKWRRADKRAAKTALRTHEGSGRSDVASLRSA